MTIPFNQIFLIRFTVLQNAESRQLEKKSLPGITKHEGHVAKARTGHASRVANSYPYTTTVICARTAQLTPEILKGL